MASKRVSKKVIIGVTEEEYNDALSAYATADAEADKLVAKMDLEITKVRDKYLDKVEELRVRLEKNYELIQTYCLQNKDVLFAKKKSIETAHGVVGFRTGNHQLKTLPKYTWKIVLDKVKKILPAYVRTKEEVNKETLLADREKKGVKEHLADVGIYVVQDEAFYVELKKETVEMPE